MNFYKKILIAVIPLLSLVYGCNQENIDVEENVNIKEPEVIFVTNKQYETSGMEFGKLSSQIFYHKISATGLVDVPPKDKAYVNVYYGGTVKEIKLLVGHSVNKGDLLFTLQSPEFIKMQQNYLTAKRELDFLKSEYERTSKLYDEKITSHKDYSKSEADYYKVLAEFEALKKELALLNVNYNKLTAESISPTVRILAPISGSVSKVNIVNGQYLDPNQTAVSIINTNHIHLELKVFEKDIADIKVGQEINFTSQGLGSKIYKAEVLVVGKSIDPEDRSIDIHAHIEDSEGNNLVPGMFVNAEILANGSANNALPSEAAVKLEKKYFVLVKVGSDENGYSLEEKEVVIGADSDQYVQILNADDFSSDTEFLVKGAFNLIN